jgi:hypothetical protein
MESDIVAADDFGQGSSYTMARFLKVEKEIVKWD